MGSPVKPAKAVSDDRTRVHVAPNANRPAKPHSPPKGTRGAGPCPLTDREVRHTDFQQAKARADDVAGAGIAAPPRSVRRLERSPLIRVTTPVRGSKALAPPTGRPVSSTMMRGSGSVNSQPAAAALPRLGCIDRGQTGTPPDPRRHPKGRSPHPSAVRHPPQHRGQAPPRVCCE